MTLLKIDSGPDSGPEETVAGSRPRVFEVFSPNSGTLMIMRKTSPSMSCGSAPPYFLPYIIILRIPEPSSSARSISLKNAPITGFFFVYLIYSRPRGLCTEPFLTADRRRVERAHLYQAHKICEKLLTSRE